jgi:hypothetical protein
MTDLDLGEINLSELEGQALATQEYKIRNRTLNRDREEKMRQRALEHKKATAMLLIAAEREHGTPEGGGVHTAAHCLLCGTPEERAFKMRCALHRQFERSNVTDARRVIDRHTPEAHREAMWRAFLAHWERECEEELYCDMWIRCHWLTSASWSAYNYVLTMLDKTARCRAPGAVQGFVPQVDKPTNSEPPPGTEWRYFEGERYTPQGGVAIRNGLSTVYLKVSGMWYLVRPHRVAQVEAEQQYWQQRIGASS